MPRAAVPTGIELFYETFGDAEDPTVLLISGLAGQAIEWPEELCQLLVSRGLRVVRFDNRDIGLSTHLDAPVDIVALFTGQQVDVPYGLADMAADTVGLLDHLGLARAHLVGASMGGMIAQTVAIEHPERVLSLTSIMSTTGEPDVGAPSAAALQQIMSPPARTREEAQDQRIAQAGVWGSPAHLEEDQRRAMAGAAWDRDRDPWGPARQLAAILSSGSRAEGLASLAVPTLVIHGTEDGLVHRSGGERTAELVPGAKLLMIDGMGHDLPQALWPQIVDAVAGHAAAHTPA